MTICEHLNRGLRVAILATLAAVALATSNSGHTAKANGHRVVRRSFTVTALPTPSPSIYFTDCFGDDGFSSANTARHPFVPRWDGYLIAEITSAAGGWRLLVRESDDQSRFNRLAMTSSTTSAISLRRGQAVQLIACNQAGLPEAEVRFEFFERRAQPEASPGRKTEWKKTLEYTHPSIGMVWPVRYEFTCTGMDCPGVHVTSADRYVTAEADDATGMDVSAMIYQWSEETGGFREDYFCTKTTKPIPLMPGVSGVGVAAAFGPCADGTPALATSGEITITLSNRR